MRVLLSTWGSRGDVEPLLGFAVALKELGAEVRLCAPPDFSDLAARVGVEMVPAGRSVRELVHGVHDRRPSTPADAPRVAAELVAAQFETVAAASDGCDAVIATGLMPAGVRTVAEVRDIPYVLAAFQARSFPAPHQTPLPRPGKPFPPGVTDNRVLWEVDAERVQALYGAPLNTHREALGLPPVDNVRDHVFTDHPWLAADPTLDPWPGSPDLDVVQTGAWILPDARPLPADLEAFLDAGAPPVYVSFGSVRAPEDAAVVAIEAIRAQGRRVVVSRGWADLALIDDRDDCFVVGEVNHQALFEKVAAVVHHGGAGTTTTATRAGAPQVVVPQIADQPYWAGRVAALGIGVAHDGSTPTLESLSAALSTALSPAIRARATAVAATIRTDGATVAATLLLDAVGQGV
ncbi:glycosyltransferase [Mycobacterium sp. AZCC_0083]|uniref:glycosyltransferase n=1 Tax=Mycobacterium sp. AZCC_0083 TaxID=2735882 RepID=UPI00160F2F22|nr:glycosyltransferase [Mycobacterium sp. AZCC_0083]